VAAGALALSLRRRAPPSRGGPDGWNCSVTRWLNAGCRSCIVGERCWRSGHEGGRARPPRRCCGPRRSRCRLQDREGSSPHSSSTSAAAVTRFGDRAHDRTSARIIRGRSQGAEPQACASVLSFDPASQVLPLLRSCGEDAGLGRRHTRGSGTLETQHTPPLTPPSFREKLVRQETARCVLVLGGKPSRKARLGAE
jgi:hypothetical protein